MQKHPFEFPTRRWFTGQRITDYARGFLRGSRAFPCGPCGIGSAFFGAQIPSKRTRCEVHSTQRFDTCSGYTAALGFSTPPAFALFDGERHGGSCFAGRFYAHEMTAAGTQPGIVADRCPTLTTRDEIHSASKYGPEFGSVDPPAQKSCCFQNFLKPFSSGSSITA